MSQADRYLSREIREAQMAQIDRNIIARAADWLMFGEGFDGLTDWGARRLLDYPSIVWG